MNTIMTFLSRLLPPQTPEPDTFEQDWDHARAEAAPFGPSHVAEIDAIFARQH